MFSILSLVPVVEKGPFAPVQGKKLFGAQYLFRGAEAEVLSVEAEHRLHVLLAALAGLGIRTDLRIDTRY